MSLDLLGPADAPNAVTTRPADARVFGTADTYFQGCSAPDVDDGTEIDASFLNGVLCQIREAIRGMGVTLNNADDDMLLKAIQSIGLRYAADTGSVNAIVAALAPAPSAYTAGLTALLKVANTNTNVATVNLNGLGNKALIHSDGSALSPGDLTAGGLILIGYDGTQFQILSRLNTAPAVGTSSLRLTGSAAGGTKTASWTALELIAETALGGAAYKGANLTLNFNGASTGAGGMDTGGVPASADLNIYAIYNAGTATWNTLGTVACHGPIYTGGNMPAGFTASALIWAGVADAFNMLPQFFQDGGKIFIASATVLSAPFAGPSGAPVAWTSIGLSAVVPVAARQIGGHQGLSAYSGTPGGVAMGVAADAAGLVVQYCDVGPTSGGYPTIDGWASGAAIFTLSLTAAQTMYWKTGGGGYATYRVTINSYSL
jgi:hypothetical protein